MNPIVAWIEAHRMADWDSPQTRASYEAIHGAVSDAQWGRGLEMVTLRNDVREALAGAAGADVIGDVVGQYNLFGSDVTVPFRIVGRDAAGHRVTVLVDVQVPADATVDDLTQLAQDAAADQALSYGMSIDSVTIAAGVYAN